MRRLVVFVLAVILICAAVMPSVSASAAVDNGDEVIVISMSIGSPIMTINGRQQTFDDEGTVPILRNGRTLVPLRAIYEAFSLEVEFVNGEITGTRGNTEIRLSINNHVAHRGARQYWLDTPPRIVNGRTMVPIRFVAESLGADVEWIGETQTINITQVRQYVSLGNVRVYMGDSLERVEGILGVQDRIDPGDHDFRWHVYNSDYRRFIMVGIKNGYVEALYTNASGFETINAKYGDKPDDIVSMHGTQVWHDSNAGDAAHAVLIVSDDLERRSNYDDSYYRAQERQIFDLTNVFRVNNGKPALGYDDTAERTARNHSRDMSERRFFDHNTPEGITPWARYRNNNGRYHGSGENIAWGFSTAIGAFDGWVNSAGHRSNMLMSHDFLGVGVYGLYMTQFFTRR